MDTTLLQVLPCALSSGSLQQESMVKIGRKIEGLKKPQGLTVLVVFLRGALDDNACLARQELNSFRKTKALVFHNEGEDVAADLATETMIELLLGVHGEGGGLLIVKRTKGLEPPPAGIDQLEIVIPQ